MDTARIRFTSLLVREVGERVKRITGGAIATGPMGTHPEHGASYADAHEQITWYGRMGARQACAYYTAAAMAWLRETGTPPGDDGEFFLAVQVAYGPHSGASAADLAEFDRWEARGAERARKFAIR